MDISTATTLCTLAKSAYEKLRKHINFKTTFTKAGKTITTLETDTNSDIAEKINILFSEERMKELAQKCKNINGYELLDFIDTWLRNYFNTYDLEEFDLERYIKVFNNEFIEILKTQCPELYDQYYSKESRDINSQEHGQILDEIHYLTDLLTDVTQYGLTLYDLEERLKNSTEPYNLNFGFFDYDEREFDKDIIKGLTAKKVLKVKFRSREEGMYYVLRLIKFYLPELVNRVLVVEREEQWYRLARIAKDMVLIPVFKAKSIYPLPANQLILIYTEEDLCGKEKLITVPDRTRTNLYYALSSYVSDFDERQQLLEKITGVYPALMRQLSCNSYMDKPAWAKEDVEVFVSAALLGAWSVLDGDKAVISELAGIPYDVFIDIIKEYLGKEDPFLIRCDSFSGVVYKVSDNIESIDCLKEKLNGSILEKFTRCVKKIIGAPNSDTCKTGLPSSNGNYSRVLKNGIARTLVVMTLFEYTYGDGYGEDLQSFVQTLVKEIMDGLHSQNDWETVCEMLPFLVEAAPSVVIDRLEKCVASNDETFWSLFKPGNSIYSTNSSYVYILNALSKALFIKDVSVRALRVLEDIAEKLFTYKSTNTPISILCAFFSPMIYEINAGPEEKVVLLRDYAEKYPDSCWLVLKDILKANFNVLWEPLDKPLYYVYEKFSQKLLYKTVIDTIKQYYLLAFQCAGNDLSKWGFFIEKGLYLRYGFRDLVVTEISKLLCDGRYSDEDRYSFEKTIRIFLHNQRFLAGNFCFEGDDLLYIEKYLLEKIPYQDAIYKILYVFDGDWLDIHPYSLEEEKKDDEGGHFKNFNKNVSEQKKVLQENIITGKYQLSELVLKTADNYDLGGHILEICHKTVFDIDFAYFLFKNGKKEILQGYLTKALGCLENDEFFRLYKQVSENFKEIDFGFKFLSSHTIDEDFIKRLQLLGQDEQDYYWENIHHTWFKDKILEIVEKYVLNTVQRGNFRKALWLVYDFDFRIGTYTQILESILQYPNNKVEFYLVQNVFEKIYEYEDLDSSLKSKIIKLEAGFVEVFDDVHKPKYLLEKLKNDALFCVDLLSSIYKKEQDNTEMSTNGQNDEHNDGSCSPQFVKENEENLSWQSGLILSNVQFCPCEKDGDIDCRKIDNWCEEYVAAIHEADRMKIGSAYLGQFLANCPDVAEREAWPLPAVCKVIEKYYSQELQDGFITGVLNNRGAHCINEGSEERNIADKYEQYAKQLAAEYPKTSIMLFLLRDHYRGVSHFFRNRAVYEY